MVRYRWMSFVFIFSLAGTTLSAQTLADFARQERDRKKQLESKQLYTNASLRPVTADAPATVQAQTAKPAETAKDSKPTGPTDSKGRDETYWRGAFATARQNLTRAEDKAKVIQLKLNDMSAELLRTSIYTREIVLRSDIEKTRRELDVAQQEVATARNKIRELEDELRRSNGLPGWAR